MFFFLLGEGQGVAKMREKWVSDFYIGIVRNLFILV